MGWCLRGNDMGWCLRENDMGWCLRENDMGWCLRENDKGLPTVELREDMFVREHWLPKREGTHEVGRTRAQTYLPLMHSLQARAQLFIVGVPFTKITLTHGFGPRASYTGFFRLVPTFLAALLPEKPQIPESKE